MSKGSKRRPGNEDAYRENWDRIFGTAWCYLCGSDGPLTDTDNMCAECHKLIDGFIVNPFDKIREDDICP